MEEEKNNENILVLIDTREQDALKQIELTKPFAFETVSLDVYDFLICRRFLISDYHTLLSCFPAARAFYNPVVESFRGISDAQKKADLQKYVWIPLLGIERKTPEDLAASITGKSSTPNFARFKDQKLRIHAFELATGCRSCLLLEGQHRVAQAQKIGSMSEEGYHTSILNTWLRDSMFVQTTVNMFDTVRTLTKMCRTVKEKGIQNAIFQGVYKKAAEQMCSKLESPTFVDEVTQIVSELLPTRQLYDGIVPTEQLRNDHSQIISIRKKDNRDPKLCYQMMLMCIVGISETAAKAIVARYKTLPKLLKAFEESKDASKLLVSVPMGTFTSTGKERQLGPAKAAAIYETFFFGEKKERKHLKKKQKTNHDESV